MLGADRSGVMLEEKVGERAPNRLVAAINWIVETAAMILMASLAFLVFINAAGRYAFAAPLPWTEELAIYILVWLGALGIVMAGLRQTLICCDIVMGRLPLRRQRALAVFCAVAGAAVMTYCAWLTWIYLGLFGADRSPVLHLPKGIVIAAIFFALVGLAATLLVPIFKRR